MKRLAFLLPLAVACTLDDPATTEVESAGTSYQGTSYQGTSYQGTSYQGTSYQGTSYQGTSYQGATYGGSTLSSASVAGTTISTWKLLPNWTWQQRLPNQVCSWNYFRTQSVCTLVNLASQPSPLAGTMFPATFIAADGSTVSGSVQIGTGPTAVGAVTTDTTVAMFPVPGTGAMTSCDNPAGCRKNSDLWLYDVKLVETGTGKLLPFCPAGQVALAVGGTWDATGERNTSSSTQFTFACTSGTIAKCTRWGYRPWVTSALESDGVTYGNPAALHQACIRGATADYCANGHSFTKNGTLVDIYDYEPQQPTAGFIPRTESLLYLAGQPAATALISESSFDQHGAVWLDFYRYQELVGTSSYGSLDDPDVGCPGKFQPGTAPEPGQLHQPITRDFATYPETAPMITIDTTSVCDHSERQVGKWLHPTCNACTRYLWQTHGSGYGCINASGAWDASCVSAARNECGAAAIALTTTHDECSAGLSLYKYATGCTLSVCLDPAYASCCTSTWTSACVAAANARCVGGQEHVRFGEPYGFCNTLIGSTAGYSL